MKIHVNKPSSLIGVINIPLDILKLALSVPAELLTLRVKQIQDERDLTQAQAQKLTYELENIIISFSRCCKTTGYTSKVNAPP